MTPVANQTLQARPNVLHGGSIPNTLGGVGPAQVAARLQNQRWPYAAALAALAALALVLLVWHP